MEIYFLIFLLAIISVWDQRKHVVPNAFVLLLIATGMVFAWGEHGWSGLFESVFTLFVVTLVLFAVWAVLELVKVPVFGAGDMKLLIAISAFFSIKEVVYVGFVAVIVAAGIFVFLVSFKQVVSMFKNGIYYLFYQYPLSKPKLEKRLAFSFPVMVAVVVLLSFGVIG